MFFAQTYILFQLYIMTLGCLAPYRRLGIGTRMLEHVLNIVKEDGNYTSIFLHVQVISYFRYAAVKCQLAFSKAE